MQSRGTILLLLAVLAVGALLWREGMPELEGRPTGETAPEMPPFTPLLTIDATTAIAVTLSDGARHHRIDKPSTGWGAIESGDSIATFLDALGGIGRVQEIPTGPDDLADFDLAPPRRRVELRFPDNSVITLDLGAHNPSTTGVYVRLNDSDVVILAGGLLQWEFDKLWRAVS